MGINLPWKLLKFGQIWVKIDHKNGQKMVNFSRNFSRRISREKCEKCACLNLISRKNLMHPQISIWLIGITLLFFYCVAISVLFPISNSKMIFNWSTYEICVMTDVQLEWQKNFQWGLGKCHLWCFRFPMQ